MVERRKILLSVALASMAGAAMADIDEAQYRSKYPFAGDASPATIKEHPDGIHRVIANYAMRECDIEGGDAEVLAFYHQQKLLRSYSLKDLFPDPKTWGFHRASGAFLWLLFSPHRNGFYDHTFTVVTVTGVRRFDVRTGDLIEMENKPSPL
ncbi:MAG TPA: hypothetical protein PLA50_03625 [Bacteroidia bacterium]|nr:hypothetical protein [Bacteroidia bacterium]